MMERDVIHHKGRPGQNIEVFHEFHKINFAAIVVQNVVTNDAICRHGQQQCEL
jgi:hypothetical protein